ncbi:hypothetical protein [Methylobacter sp. BlB1]|uniref:hypothetical protein n=1 Tax=Methylobacter sp. BlB1 TaxID=2785914 RepID=UPI001895D243|nr:hypothetical protein [Methylobacter sp. BlB1]MBF6649175.1 hypothetical protein [Methylobacter sp. BlB1]
MSDSNNGGGLLTGLLLDAGFTTMILAPFYIGHRYGVHVLALISAGLATFYAIISPELVAIAKEDIGYCGLNCLAGTAAEVILELDKIGWWWIAASMWLVASLCWVAQAVKPGLISADS